MVRFSQHVFFQYDRDSLPFYGRWEKMKEEKKEVKGEMLVGGKLEKTEEDKNAKWKEGGRRKEEWMEGKGLRKQEGRKKEVYKNRDEIYSNLKIKYVYNVICYVFSCIPMSLK